MRAARYESSLGSQRDSTRLDVMGRVRRDRPGHLDLRARRSKASSVCVGVQELGRARAQGREIRVGLEYSLRCRAEAGALTPSLAECREHFGGGREAGV